MDQHAPVDPRIISYIDVATSCIGNEEHPKGSNWGHPVQDYLARVNITSPAPWCMAFVVWCLREAGIAPDLFPTTGSCTYALNWARHHDVLCQDPEAGDVFILVDPGHVWGHHCGFVTGVKGNVVYTIEGNTDTTGSPEGYEVAARERHTSNEIVFVGVV